jgi:uncharacterized protein (TIGR00255 family)
MPLISMTGFGRGQSSAEGIKVDVELSSVNRKQFDLHLSLPRELASLEAKIHAIVHKQVRRGHVKGMVRLSLAPGGRQQAVHIDESLARTQVTALRRTAKALGLADDLTAQCLLTLPDVVVLDTHPHDSQKLWPLIQQAMKQALEALMAMRRHEGEALAADMTKRFARLQKPLVQIGKRAPAVVTAHRRALMSRLGEAGIELATDDPTLIREVAVFADRCDISEELTRLASHFGQVEKLMSSKAPCGRSLDFLCQEMFREINTIGSKANDALIARHVIRFKAGLEAIREQVQNIE